MSGGMPVYRKQGDPDCWLMYHPSLKMWTLVHTYKKGTHTVIELSQDVDMDISIATPQELADASALIAAAAEALAVSVRADGHKVRICTDVGFNEIC